MILATAILAILTGWRCQWHGWQSSGRKSASCGRIYGSCGTLSIRYKGATDCGGFQTKVCSEGYPPDLETLVKRRGCGRREIALPAPHPPIQGPNSTEWLLHSMQDDSASDSWGGQNALDVFTKVQGTGLDGTEYKDW